MSLPKHVTSIKCPRSAYKSWSDWLNEVLWQIPVADVWHSDAFVTVQISEDPEAWTILVVGYLIGNERVWKAYRWLEFSSQENAKAFGLSQKLSRSPSEVYQENIPDGYDFTSDANILKQAVKGVAVGYNYNIGDYIIAKLGSSSVYRLCVASLIGENVIGFRIASDSYFYRKDAKIAAMQSLYTISNVVKAKAPERTPKYSDIIKDSYTLSIRIQSKLRRKNNSGNLRVVSFESEDKRRHLTIPCVESQNGALWPLENLLDKTTKFADYIDPWLTDAERLQFIDLMRIVSAHYKKTGKLQCYGNEVALEAICRVFNVGNWEPL